VERLGVSGGDSEETEPLLSWEGIYFGADFGEVRHGGADRVFWFRIAPTVLVPSKEVLPRVSVYW